MQNVTLFENKFYVKEIILVQWGVPDQGMFRPDLTERLVDAQFVSNLLFYTSIMPKSVKLY